ncbi:hypothetical protein RJ639_039391 [Escallonia herrerae]|uniref:Clp R domain-containing protein n=1 Tax=Escallonia herrerae TaxID=1293975 RepID=A0AA88WM00_9ASTE|nr:hypothetical protein RJ639_039391 [Escallonia herrerae]
MRSGGFTVQQALTADAATVIKQAITLARRRGHAQVTPLHVANTMLTASTGLLRTACLQSHSHPLQCKALELCFNVALNRLPASSSSPMLGPHSQHPSISNALVAAFKRAQAHQRRGSIENQQQPLLAVKIELEQLIISILDDPSVSRVMREAGFSSTQVKSNVEQAVSLELCSQTPSPSSIKSKENNSLVKPRGNDQIREEDVRDVIENLINNKRKGLVVVGECLSSIEGVVGRVMEKVDKGEVPDGLREVKFISLPLYAFGRLSKEEVERKLGELKCLVKSFVEKGVVLYIGDLKWIIEYRGSTSSCYYCPVEDMIVDIGRLVCGIGESGGRFWLMGTATFRTYMSCRNGHPSLESVWGLHPLTIPAGSLGLSLLHDSDTQNDTASKKAGNGSSWLLLEGEEEKQLTCCIDCSAKYESEVRSSRSSTFNSDSTSSSSLPSWLKDENKRLNNSDQESLSVKELRKKWNSFCSSVHKPLQSRTLTFSSVSPSSSTSCFSYDQHNSILCKSHQEWPMFEPKKLMQDNQFWRSLSFNKTCEPSLRLYISNSSPNSASSSDNMETDYVQRFKEFNAENLKTLCNALENKVPWQKDIVPEIAGTVLQCRSGMMRRKNNLTRPCSVAKEETWLFFQGVDVQAKEKIAKELAKAVFASHSKFVSIALSSFSSTRADSTEDYRSKRTRDEKSSSYIERFAEALSSDPHRVFLVEDVEQADYCSQMGIKWAIESGKLMNSNGEEVGLADAIVILSCESFSSRSRTCSLPNKQKLEGLEDISPCVSWDLNMSFEDDGDVVEDQSIDDIGLLESVDRCIVFKIQDL